MTPRLVFVVSLLVSCPLVVLASAQVSETLDISIDPDAGDEFGASVAMYIDRAVIGAPGDDAAGVDAGAAYILDRQPDGSWLTVATLTASDASAGDAFGSAVGVFADFAVVGAPQDDGAGVDSGSAYVYERQLDGTWLERAHLVAADAAAFDFFGGATAMWVSTAVIGATGDDLGATANPAELSGAVYTFARQLDGTWPQTNKLKAPHQGSAAAFGTSVSINGSRLIAGAPGQSNGGAAFVFEGQGGGIFGFIQQFQPDPPPGGQEFGTAVSASGSHALVAAPGEGDGVAYVFRQVSGVWGLETKLVGDDVAPGDGFARHAQLGGSRAFVGAPLQGQGAAYVFEEQTGHVWVQAEKLQPSAASASAEFGRSGLTFQERALVGAPEDDGTGGAVLFQLSPLQIDTPIVHLSSGSTQTFFLDAGHSNAGKFYWLLGSASGSQPGIPFAGGSVLPLNPDAYLNYTLANPNSPPLANSLGLLDASGLGTATFLVPPGTSLAFSGLPVFHAFIVLQPGSGTLQFVSNAQPSILEP